MASLTDLISCNLFSAHSSTHPFNLSRFKLILSVSATGWQAEMDAYVVHTNYQEYAIVITSRQKSSGNATIAMKLLSEWDH